MCIMGRRYSYIVSFLSRLQLQASGYKSACKTIQTFIRAPLESRHPQLANGARMRIWVVLHVELWPLEVDGGTGGTQYLSTFAILLATRIWTLT